MEFRNTTIAVLLVAFVLQLLPSISTGTVLEEAKKEGSLILYGSMSASDMQSVAQGFEKKYPGVKVNVYRANTERVLNRVLTEGMAGKFFVDAVIIDSLSAWALKDKDFLQAYKSKEAQAFPKAFKDPEGIIQCCIYVITNVIGYNTKLVAKAEAPRTYQDLLDPKWKGRLGMDMDEAEWFRALISVWGKEKTVDYFKALMKQRPAMRRGHSLLAQLTAAGEIPVAVNVFGFRMLEMQQDGAPLEIVQANPIIAAPRHVVLAKKAPHPNAGRLFIDYILSVEGQQLLSSIGRTVIRPGVKPKHPRLVEGGELYPVKPEMAKDFDQSFKLYYSIVRNK